MGGAHPPSGCSVGTKNYVRSSFSQWVLSMTVGLELDMFISVILHVHYIMPTISCPDFETIECYQLF